MFFFLSKVLDLAFSPLTWAIVAILALAVRHRKNWRNHKASVFVPVGTALALYVFSTAPISNALTHSLEGAAVTTHRPDVEYDAVVVLGGVVDFAGMTETGRPSYNDNVERLLVAYDLLRTGRAKHGILSGGSMDDDPPEATVLAQQLASWGIAKERLIEEPASRNTRENAVFSERIVRERGFQSVLIITSAFHMKRAAGCFRSVGMRFDTLAVDFRAKPARRVGSVLPRSDFLAESTAALREHAGWLVYRARGYATP